MKSSLRADYNQCKLVIFDLDGTLVNAYPAVTHSVNYVLHKLGFSRRSYAFIKAAVGWGDRHLMADLVGEDLADKAIKLYRPHHAKALCISGGVKFLPDAKALLSFLKKHGYKLAIASNRPTRFTRIILRTLKITKFFDMVLCADRASRPKPYPDMLLDIVRELKVKKTEVLYVGDMTIDLITGQKAGIRTIAVSTGSSSVKELKDLKPEAILSRIGALKQTIITVRRCHE